MARSWETRSDRVATLEELVEFVEAKVDLRDPETVCRAAPLLGQLANDRALLARTIVEELADWETFQRQNKYYSPAFILARRPGFVVRAIPWLPDPGAEARLDPFYGVAHNHTMAFLTAGYLGPGYATEIYECDADRLPAEVGARVELRALERTTLPPGKVMYYRYLADVHTQRPPPALSVSLSLLVLTPGLDTRDQHYFDVARGTVAGLGGPMNAARAALCAIAGSLDPAGSAATLARVSAAHPSAIVRAAAGEQPIHATPHPTRGGAR
jgi:hypothetical protein